MSSIESDESYPAKQIVLAPVIDRKLSFEQPRQRKKSLYIAVVLAAILIVPGFAIISPSFMGLTATTPDDLRAGVQEMGDREVSYTISNFFELYDKSSEYGDMGAVDDMGVSEFWDVRNDAYGDLFIREDYPFTMLYNYYSTRLASLTMPEMGYGVYSFYRTYMDANNISEVGTGSGKDPHFIPILNPSGAALDGGSVLWNWQITYLTSQECDDIADGLHYANTYYGVPTGAVTFTSAEATDGWWNELHGTMTFDRCAAVKFLNLPGTGDLRDEFNTANSGGALNDDWASHWTTDGTASGSYDIYAAYDWSIDSGTVDAWLTVDTGESTADSLVLRIWGHAWGYEILMMRYLETVGLMQYFQTYAEDIYLNGTCGSEGGDLDLRLTSFYKINAWKNPEVWSAAWNLDTMHIDACANTLKNPVSAWDSHYNDYNAVKTPSYLPTMREWTPGTTNYGELVRYWQPPEEYDIADGERVSIVLGDSPALGYQPYVGASDTIDVSKANELTTHAYWGELVLGSCYPSTIADYYDPDTKTVTLEGPIDFPDAPDNENPSAFPNCHASGSPQYVFAVSNVSYYQIEMLDVGPYQPGIAYSLRVTAKNLTDITVTGWNGTVTLTCNNPGTAFGDSSHLFNPSVDHGVWETTVTFGAPSHNTYINATDAWFPLDVNGGLTPGDIGTVIPEFSMVLIPVIGMAVIVALAGRRRRQDKA